jgi:hypothetical protein
MNTTLTTQKNDTVLCVDLHSCKGWDLFKGILPSFPLDVEILI